MEAAICLSGNTYPYRKELKLLAGKWSKDHSGWLIPIKNEKQARALVISHSLYYEYVDVEAEDLETPTGERLCAIRQDKAEVA